MATRKPGQRKPNYDDESTADLLKNVKKLVRTDWGGKDAIEQIVKKMAEDDVNCGPIAAAAIKKMIEKAVRGNRERIFPRIDEAIRRLSGTSEDDFQETLP